MTFAIRRLNYRNPNGLDTLVPASGPRLGDASARTRGRRDLAVSQFFDRLTFFRKYIDRFSNGFGVVTDENRAW
jgi:hypothetical protein